ncbi:hypothetical protein HNY73_002218 [Argiope bruennichi]|uniref:Uncharacterized protein n=1 Tax=Argiope bruennichi TaxID=94029 RepID=A0A8T0FST9_ARGBR|nr:hypothetical protein HNY73_002218 [Argiope bruennichi]
MPPLNRYLSKMKFANSEMNSPSTATRQQSNGDAASNETGCGITKGKHVGGGAHRTNSSSAVGYTSFLVASAETTLEENTFGSDND